MLIAVFLLSGLQYPSTSMRAEALGTECSTSSSPGAVYLVTVCLASPADNATVSGNTSISATVSVTGTNPGVQKLLFYLGGEYLLTDYAAPYTFVIPTTKFVDGTRLLEVEAKMRDGLTYGRGAITLTFVNGIVQPPVNTNSFTPASGTSPAAGRPFVLVATGDGASGEPNAIAVTDLIAGLNPNMFLYLGDVYDDGTATEFHNWYGTGSDHYSRFRAITNPTIGNHEYQGLNAPGYFDYWNNVPHYYSFNASGWHFINLDSTGQFNQTLPGTPQYDWLAQDLAANTAACTVAYFHHPVYNVGAEGEASRMNSIWTLLAQYGVDIVLTGHDHDYQRWQPMNGQGQLSPNGMTEFVVGTGGHGIQDFIRTDSRLAIGFNTPPTAFGALRMELNSHGAAFQFINIQGNILDSGSIPCSGAPVDTTPPNAPTNLSASSISSSHINLSWTSATDNVGVTGYQIYRDGTLLDTVGAGTSYTDNTVSGNVSYQYQVRAVDAVGNVSGLSNQATVTASAFLFSDDFESGSLTKWTSIDGLSVQQQDVYEGSYAARETSTGAGTSAYKEFLTSQNELYYRLRFKVTDTTSNAYLLKFRTSSASLLGVYVNSAGKLAYRNDFAGATTTSTTTVSFGVWHDLQVRVLINGVNSQTETWLDGMRVDALSKTESLGSTGIRRVQLGDNAGGTYSVAFDNVAVNTSFIEMTVPTVSLSEPLEGALVREAVTLSALASDDVAIDRVEFFANGSLIGTDYTAPYNIIWDSSGIADGPVTLTARAVDVATNATTSVARTVSVDNTPPNTTITSGPSGTVNSNSATFTFSSTEPASFLCTLDGEEIEGCASPQTFTNLSGGSHLFQVTATDLAGNNDPTPASRNWTSSSNAPGTFSKTSPSNGAGSQSSPLTLSWTASSGASSYQYCFDTTNNNTCDNNAWQNVGMNTSAPVSSLVVDTLYYWQVMAVNTSGATSANSGVWWSFRTPDRTFSDVDSNYWAVNFIERLYAAGITGGCGTSPLRYCPEGTVTRAQIAVFLLRGIHGASYGPPSVGGSSGFNDVPTDYWAGAWIKQLAAEGITSGCRSDYYCPEQPVTRAQMAVFLLRSKHGVSYTPPGIGVGTGFNDVPPGYWAAAWIKQLVTEGITSGCGSGNYCPESAVTRAQMAVFLVKTFSLP